jgi:hypothetical protein
MREQFVSFDDVDALLEQDQQLLCRVQGHDVWIPSDRIAIDDHVVTKPGDHGRLVITWTTAMHLGLAPMPPGMTGDHLS